MWLLCSRTYKWLQISQQKSKSSVFLYLLALTFYIPFNTSTTNILATNVLSISQIRKAGCHLRTFQLAISSGIALRLCFAWLAPSLYSVFTKMFPWGFPSLQYVKLPPLLYFLNRTYQLEIKYGIFYFVHIPHENASQVVLVVKNLLASAGDIRDTVSMPGLGRSLGGGHGNPPSVLG